MGERRRASRRAIGRPTASGRETFTTVVDLGLQQDIRALAKRKKAKICDVVELALRRHLMEETATREDAALAPLVGRVIETQHKKLEGGLRTMIARLAHENLAIQYILCNFMVEASVPTAKVERWRTDGKKFAIQEFRRKRPELEEPPEDDDQI